MLIEVKRECKMPKIKVLQVVGQLTIGGQEMMVMNFYRFIDRTAIEFHFLVYGDNVGELEEEAERLGGKVMHTPSFAEIGYKEFIKNIEKVIDVNGPYQAVHCHTSFNSGLILKIARNKGIPVRIAHSHTTKPGKKATVPYKLYTSFMRRRILNNATHLLACGKEAGNYLYGESRFFKKGIIIKNGINTRIFTIDNHIRENMRNKLGIEGKFVIGHVGRMSVEKNHSFLMDVFNEVYSKDKDTILLLVGTGTLLPELKKKAMELGIENNVVFAGQRTDIAEVLQAMDIFVFPSIYEGLPVSVVEAQASGLPCVVSSNVTSEIKVTQLVEFLDLAASVKKWADVILEKQYSKRRFVTEEIEKSGYDITDICRKLEVLYCKGELK